MRYLLRLIFIISGAVCLLFPLARLLGAQRTEGQIVYAAQIPNTSSDIHLLDVRTLIIIPITRTPEQIEYRPMWFTDENAILFTRFDLRNGTYSTQRVNLFYLESEEFDETQRNSCCINPYLSPNGQQIVFINHAGENNGVAIYTMNSECIIGQYCEAGVPQQITSKINSLSSPAWSHDGQWIVYSTYEATRYQLYSIRIDGTERHRITFDNYYNDLPSWSILQSP